MLSHNYLEYNNMDEFYVFSDSIKFLTPNWYKEKKNKTDDTN